MLYLVYKISGFMENKGIVRVVIDFSKVFDTVNHKIIAQKMELFDVKLEVFSGSRVTFNTKNIA